MREFHGRLLADYTEEMSGEKNVLFKMKELWFYMIHVFTNHEKYEKKIRKVQRLCDYKEIVGVCSRRRKSETVICGIKGLGREVISERAVPTYNLCLLRRLYRAGNY
ncbi:MAG: hypothetical protein V8R80_10475 [Eubacterium sp.]